MTPRFTVTRYPYQQGGYDDLGNPLQGYGPPEQVKVFGWYRPVIDTSTNQPARDDLSKRLTLMLPAGSPGSDRDKWVVDGEEWYQNGSVQDYSHGNPFGYQRVAQAVINLSQVEG